MALFSHNSFNYFDIYNKSLIIKKVFNFKKKEIDIF